MAQRFQSRQGPQHKVAWARATKNPRRQRSQHGKGPFPKAAEARLPPKRYNRATNGRRPRVLESPRPVPHSIGAAHDLKAERPMHQSEESPGVPKAAKAPGANRRGPVGSCFESGEGPRRNMRGALVVQKWWVPTPKIGGGPSAPQMVGPLPKGGGGLCNPKGAQALAPK